MYIPYLDEKINKNEYLRGVLEIHFNPENGSPYWIEKEKNLGIDVRSEIREYKDLHKLGFSKEEDLKNRPSEDFIPKKYPKKEFDMGESSGTTGAKKTVPWLNEISEKIIEFYNFNLDLNDFPKNINWFSAGPSGIYESHMESVAKKRGGLFFFSPINPRGFKTATKKELKRRIKPTTEDLIEKEMKEEIEILTSSPSFFSMFMNNLEMNNKELHKKIKEKTKGMIVSGTSLNPKNYQKIDEIFENPKLVPMYSNIFWGPALNPNQEKYNLEYFPPEPFVSFEVVDPETKKSVDYEERGQLLVHRIDKGFFWPNHLERDSVVKINPKEPYEWSGVKDVKPLS